MTYQLASKLLCELLSLERESQRLLQKQEYTSKEEEILMRLIKEKVKAS